MMKLFAYGITIIILFFSSLIHAQDMGMQNRDTTNLQQIMPRANPFIDFRLATQGIVLLKNNGGLLPLNLNEIHSIALIGPTLNNPGAGLGVHPSANLKAFTTPYEGIAKYAGDSVFLYTAVGVNMKNDVAPLDSSNVYIGQGVHGFSAKYYNGPEPSGTPEIFATDKQIDFNWEDPPYEELDSVFSVSWDATLIAQHGPVKIKLIHNDGCRLYLDGKLILNDWKSGPVRMDSAWLNIQKGESYNLKIDYFSDGESFIRFGFDYLMPLMIYEAVEKARRADVAIVFVGQPRTENYSGENRNAKSLYPGIPKQSRLIRAVYEANPNTIVVLQTKSVVDIEDWVFDVPAIIQTWSPEQQTGRSIAELLFGDINPTTKLTVWWQMNKNQNFATRFPFGYGLTYTIFGIGKLMMMRDRNGAGWTATVEIRNVGERAGTETLQVYITKAEKVVDRLEIKAFKQVFLLPEQKKTVAIPIPYSAFEYYSAEKGKWIIDPGKYTIMVGTSAEDIKLQKVIEIKNEHINHE